VRGRLQSASNQLFRRRFRHCLRDLNSHFSRGFKTVSPDLEGILQAHDRAVANQYSSACGREFSRFGACVPGLFQ